MLIDNSKITITQLDNGFVIQYVEITDVKKKIGQPRNFIAKDLEDVQRLLEKTFPPKDESSDLDGTEYVN